MLVRLMLVSVLVFYAILSSLTLCMIFFDIYIVTCTVYNCKIYRGTADPYLYAFVFKCKFQILICTQVGGALSIYFNFCAYILQIHMLSSNTKKGEIERAFPSIMYFGVC
jgi:hypothetical protein